MLQQGDTLDLSNYTKSAQGLLYKIVKSGSGTKPLRGETATVHYSGWLLQGTDTVGAPFDSSVKRGATFQFRVGLGHVISGWDIMVADMHIGEKRIVILPANFAYGSRGAGAAIPPHATLIFEIELFDAK